MVSLTKSSHISNERWTWTLLADVANSEEMSSIREHIDYIRYSIVWFRSKRVWIEVSPQLTISRTLESKLK